MAPHRTARGLQAALALALSLSVAGCATAPAQHDVERSQVFDESKDVIWERAVAFFATHHLSIIAADRQISTPVANMEGLADCGTAPLIRKLSQTADLNLFVRELGEEKTSVVVNTRFTETRILGANTMTLQTVTCVSTGKLEGEILSALRRSL